MQERKGEKRRVVHGPGAPEEGSDVRKQIADAVNAYLTPLSQPGVQGPEADKSKLKTPVPPKGSTG